MRARLSPPRSPPSATRPAATRCPAEAAHASAHQRDGEEREPGHDQVVQTGVERQGGENPGRGARRAAMRPRSTHTRAMLSSPRRRSLPGRSRSDSARVRRQTPPAQHRRREPTETRRTIDEAEAQKRAGQQTGAVPEHSPRSNRRHDVQQPTTPAIERLEIEQPRSHSSQ